MDRCRAGNRVLLPFFKDSVPRSLYFCHPEPLSLRTSLILLRISIVKIPKGRATPVHTSTDRSSSCFKPTIYSRKLIRRYFLFPTFLKLGPAQESAPFYLAKLRTRQLSELNAYWKTLSSALRDGNLKWTRVLKFISDQHQRQDTRFRKIYWKRRGNVFVRIINTWSTEMEKGALTRWDKTQTWPKKALQWRTDPIRLSWSCGSTDRKDRHW